MPNARSPVPEISHSPLNAVRADTNKKRIVYCFIPVAPEWYDFRMRSSVRDPATEVELFRAAERILLSALPPSWLVSGELVHRPRSIIDGQLAIRVPGSVLVVFLVTVKMSPKRRDLEGLFRIASGALEGDEWRNRLVVARFLSPSLREELQQARISYIDATGNIFLYTEAPVMFIKQDGAQSDPWRGPGRPVGTLKGLPAAALVRVLADYRPPCKVAELAARSGASMGATYRLVEYLEQEALITRDGAFIGTVDWLKLLWRWSQDTSNLSPTVTGRGYLEPRGLGAARSKLRLADPERYVVTGSIAAEPYAPYAETRLATIYADAPDDFAEDLGWRGVESGANVILAAPRSPAVYTRTTTTDGVRLVAPSQAVVDLLNGSGRQPAEGEALLEWMKGHESEWRR